MQKSLCTRVTLTLIGRGALQLDGRDVALQLAARLPVPPVSSGQVDLFTGRPDLLELLAAAYPLVLVRAGGRAAFTVVAPSRLLPLIHEVDPRAPLALAASVITLPSGLSQGDLVELLLVFASIDDGAEPPSRLIHAIDWTAFGRAGVPVPTTPAAKARVLGISRQAASRPPTGGTRLDQAGIADDDDGADAPHPGPSGQRPEAGSSPAPAQQSEPRPSGGAADTAGGDARNETADGAVGPHGAREDPDDRAGGGARSQQLRLPW